RFRAPPVFDRRRARNGGVHAADCRPQNPNPPATVFAHLPPSIGDGPETAAFTLPIAARKTLPSRHRFRAPPVFARRRARNGGVHAADCHPQNPTLPFGAFAAAGRAVCHFSQRVIGPMVSAHTYTPRAYSPRGFR